MPARQTCQRVRNGNNLKELNDELNNNKSSDKCIHIVYVYTQMYLRRFYATFFLLLHQHL